MASGPIYNHRSLQPSSSSAAAIPTPHTGPYPPPGSQAPGSAYPERMMPERERAAPPMNPRDRATYEDRRNAELMLREREVLIERLSERLHDPISSIKAEFDHLASEVITAQKGKEELEKQLNLQVSELQLFRNQLFELELQHNKIRQQYDEEVARLRTELASARSGGYERDRGDRDSKRMKRTDYTPVPMPASPLPPSAQQQSMPKLPPHPSPYEREPRERLPPMAPTERGISERALHERERGLMERERGIIERERERSHIERVSAYPPTNEKLFNPDKMDVDMFPNEDLTIDTIGPEWKKEGTDWWAMFNPKLGQQERIGDVSLVHALMHESVVCCVRFSRDGRYLATGCNRTAQIYDTKTGQKVCVLLDENATKTGDLYIRSVCFSPDGKYLATGAEDKQIRIWDIAKRSIRKVFDGHQQEIYSLDFSFDGRTIVSGSGDRTTRVWALDSGSSKVLNIVDTEGMNQDAGVTSVAMSPDGRYVAAGSLDTIVRIWDIETGQLVERLRAHQDSVYSVAFTPDGKGLVSGSLDRSLKVWDVSALGRPKTGEPNFIDFLGHKDYVLSVAVSHDGKWVVSGSKDRGVQFWDASRATVQAVLQGHKNSVISIDLSHAGNYLATGSGDWQARIWSYTTTSGGPP